MWQTAHWLLTPVLEVTHIISASVSLAKTSNMASLMSKDRDV